jgi:hypothetical protein
MNSKLLQKHRNLHTRKSPLFQRYGSVSPNRLAPTSGSLFGLILAMGYHRSCAVKAEQHLLFDKTRYLDKKLASGLGHLLN